MKLRGPVSTSGGFRRRALASTLVGAVLVAAAAGPAVAAPSSGKGSKVCTISDQRIYAISGMAATANGYAVVNNIGGKALAVYQLDSHCQVTNVLTDSRATASPQDLAATKDGTLWVGDIGDTDKSRDTIAVWKIPAGNSATQLYRMSYPSGAGPVDARSLLMQPDGTPIVVTYQSGIGKVYEPTGALSTTATTPLKSMGSIKLAPTGTPGGSIGPVAQQVFTGGAVSPDGTHAVLRTFTDAYQWDVKGGNVAKSIVSGKPTRTPLPNEPSGQAITYDSGGSSFLTVSDTEDIEGKPTIQRYQPSAAPPPSTTSKDDSSSGDSGGGLFSGNINLADIKELVIVVGVLGLALVIVGVVGIRRSRRRGGPTDPGDTGRSGGGPRPTGPSGRRGAMSDDDVETAYLPRVQEPGGPRARREPPGGRAPQGFYAEGAPEPSGARPYVPPIGHRDTPEPPSDPWGDDPSDEPVSGRYRRGGVDDPTTLRPGSAAPEASPYRSGGPDAAATGRRGAGPAGEPGSGRYRSGRRDDPMSDRYGPDEPPTGRHGRGGPDPVSGHYGAEEPTQGRHGSEPPAGRHGSEPASGRYGSEPASGRYGSGGLTPGRYGADEAIPGRYGAEEATPGRYGADEAAPGGYGSARPGAGRPGSEPTTGRYGSGSTAGRYGSESTAGRYGSEAAADRYGSPGSAASSSGAAGSPPGRGGSDGAPTGRYGSEESTLGRPGGADEPTAGRRGRDGTALPPAYGPGEQSWAPAAGRPRPGDGPAPTSPYDPRSDRPSGTTYGGAAPAHGHQDPDEPTLPPRTRPQQPDPSDADTATMDRIQDGPSYGSGRRPPRDQPQADWAPPPPGGRRNVDREIDWLDDLR